MENDKLVVNSQTYSLRIKTSEIKNIYINTKEYFIDENGVFRKELYLFKGMNIFNIN
jgi:hypothetical protein